MNVLIVTESFDVGGLESRLKGMITFLSREGWKVYLACGASLCRENLPGQLVEVFSGLPFDGSRLSFASIEKGVSRLQEIIRDYEIDLVDLHPFGSLLPGAIAAHESQIPFVVNLHGPVSLALGNPWYDLTTRFCILPMASMAYAVSPETYFLANLYVETSRLDVLPNGVDLEVFQLPSQELEPGKWAVVSRLDGVKDRGIQEFCSMACRAGIQHIDIFGDGPGASALRDWMAREGLGEQGHFKGASLDVAADLSCQSYEVVAGMGRVVLEAAAMNLPICLVGYNGVKGILDAELFSTAAWWNFSGRGLPDISLQQFQTQLERLREDRERHRLRAMVEGQADEKGVWEKYCHKALHLKPVTCEGAHQMRNLIKVFSDDDNNPFSNDGAMGEIVRVLDRLSNNEASRYWSQYLSRHQTTQLHNELEAVQSQKEQLRLEAEQIRGEKQALENSLAAWESKVRRVVSTIKQQEGHTSFRVAKLLHVLKHPEIVGVKGPARVLAAAFLAKATGKPLAAGYSPFDPILQELAGSLPAEASHIGEGVKPLSVYGRHEFQRLLKERLPNRKGVFVHAFSIDWDLPLFSRPQHMSMAMRDRGYLVIYADFKETEGFLEIQDNLFIAGGNWIFDFICNDLRDSIISIYSTSPWWGGKTEAIRKIRERHNAIVYEYIDHIDPKISGEGVKDLARLFRCLKEGKTEHLFVGSAKTLYEELAREIPEDRIALVPNGVNCGHYIEAMQDLNPRERLSMPMKNILDRGRPIVGYFGALAHWLDYGLLKEVIQSKPDYEFVFIGPDYYGGSNLLPLDLPNCHWLGVVHYDVLPYYALHFDVAIIPFERGDVAKSTSPLKLFEYFALEKPVVVTADLLECRIYPEVFSAETPDGFCRALDEALLQSKNPGFKERLKQLALQNTWQCRAGVLDAFIQAHVGAK